MQILVNGLLQGILLGTIGVAFALVYRTAKVFHIALGGICALAPYVVLTTLDAGIPGWGAAALAVLVAAVLGILIEEGIHWPLAHKRAPAEFI
jgi:branched-chain amino acid transport system permease protein